MAKICLYTAIFGNYEVLKKPVVIDGLDYVCFTDDKNMKSNLWDIRYMCRDGVHPSMFYKKIKCLSHEFLPKYDYTIWLDGNFRLKDKNYLTFLFDQFDSDKILLYAHRCVTGAVRTCLYHEAGQSQLYHKYDRENLNHQACVYREKYNYPSNNGLYQAGFLLRNNRDDETIAFNVAWLKEIERFGKVCPQCQVSLPFVLWQQGINFDVIKDETIWNTDRYYITDHGTNNGHSYLSQ